MPGEHNEPTTIFDAKFKPNPACARDVLAFVLTPIDVVGPLDPDEFEGVAELFYEAKEQAVDEWLRLNKRVRSR